MILKKIKFNPDKKEVKIKLTDKQINKLYKSIVKSFGFMNISEFFEDLEITVRDGRCTIQNGETDMQILYVNRHDIIDSKSRIKYVQIPIKDIKLWEQFTVGGKQFICIPERGKKKYISFPEGTALTKCFTKDELHEFRNDHSKITYETLVVSVRRLEGVNNGKNGNESRKIYQAE